MKKLIIDLDKDKVLTAFYTKTELGVTVKNVEIVDRESITKYDSIFTASSLEEAKVKLKNEFSAKTRCCNICGRAFKEGQEIYSTEDGVVACDLGELLGLLDSKWVF